MNLLNFKKTKHSYLSPIYTENIHHHTQILWEWFNQLKCNILYNKFLLNKDEVCIGELKYKLHYNTNYDNEYCQHHNCREAYIHDNNDDNDDEIPCLWYKKSVSQYWEEYLNGDFTGKVIRISNHWNSIIQTNGETTQDNFNKNINGCGSNDWYLMNVPTNYLRDQIIGGVHNIYYFTERKAYNFDFCPYESDNNNWDIDLADKDILSQTKFCNTIGFFKSINQFQIQNIKLNNDDYENYRNSLLVYLFNFKMFLNKIKKETLKQKIIDDFEVTNRLCDALEKNLVLKKKYQKMVFDTKSLLKTVRKNNLTVQKLFKHKLEYNSN